jgi:hypothetical protein
LRPGHALHLFEYFFVLRLIVPIENKWMWVAIGGVRDCDHLVQIRREACEFRQIGFGHGAGGFAVVKIRTVRVIVERPHTGDGPVVVSSVAGFLCIFRCTALQRGAIGIVVRRRTVCGGRCSVGGGVAGSSTLH